MTNYNDGKWHGWNGGECPVHPKSVVEVIHIAIGTPSEVQTHSACNQDWENVVAFRVVKEHKEPREFLISMDTMHVQAVPRGFTPDGSVTGYIHVREVIE